MYVESPDGHRMLLDVTRPDTTTDAVSSMCVLAHGIFSNHREAIFDDLATALGGVGIGSVRFDFRGHGQSSFSSTDFAPIAAVQDLSAVVRWAEDKADEVHVVGSSFGGSLAILANSLRAIQPKRILLLNPVVDYLATFVNPATEWGQNWFTAGRVKELSRSGRARLRAHFIASNQLYRELELIPLPKLAQDLPNRTLALVGGADSSVPPSYTVDILSKVGVNVEVIDEASHTWDDHAHREQVVRSSLAFLRDPEI